MNIPIDETISQFRDAVERMMRAKSYRQQSIRRTVIMFADRLRAQRDKLIERLTAGHEFLNNNPDRPDYQELEDRWMAWLASYERIEDALAESLAIWFPLDEEVA